MSFHGLSIEETLLAVLMIVVTDLVLGADNAIVIGMACRDLDPKVRTKGIILGTMGAVVVRILATIGVVWLLRIPYLKLVGGVLLEYIGFKLVAQKEDAKNVSTTDSLLRAVLTVIAADILMGIDNVLAVAGQAQDSILLVIFGLCLSIPIMVLGSTLIIKIMERFPIIIYIGAAVIFYTGGRMVTEDDSLAWLFEGNKILSYGLIGLFVGVGLLVSWLVKRHRTKSAE